MEEIKEPMPNIFTCTRCGNKEHSRESVEYPFNPQHHSACTKCKKVALLIDFSNPFNL